MPIQNTLTLLNATVNPLTCISRRFVAISAALLRYFGIISSRGRDLLQVVTSWDISRKYARSFSSYYCFFSKWDVRFHTSPDLMGMPWTVRRVNIDKYGVLFCASQDWIARLNKYVSSFISKCAFSDVGIDVSRDGVRILLPCSTWRDVQSNFSRLYPRNVKSQVDWTVPDVHGYEITTYADWDMWIFARSCSARSSYE